MQSDECHCRFFDDFLVSADYETKLWLTLITSLAYCIDKELYKAIEFLLNDSTPAMKTCFSALPKPLRINLRIIDPSSRYCKYLLIND